MTNQELFNLLSKEQQFELIHTLACYNNAHVEFYEGEYHISTSYCLRATYPSDHKVLNKFSSKEFYPNGIDYHNAWYRFWNEKEAKGEKNEIIDLPNGDFTGKWQQEFEQMLEPKYQEAYRYFTGANA